MYSLDLRWTACQLYYQRYNSVRKTADALLVSKSSVARWLNDHPVSRKIKKQNQLHEELTKWIVAQWMQNPFMSLSSLHRSLPENMQVSRSTLFRCMRQTGWTRKYTSKLQLKSRHQEAREANFLNEMKDLQDVDWISIDETCIWTDMVPTRGYAPSGKRLLLRSCDKIPVSQRKKLSMLVAVSRKGQTYCYLKEGSIKSADFARFIKQLPMPPRSNLIMDNASIHKAKEVREMLDRKLYRAIYTAPYRPDWNPVEHIFSPFKHHFRTLFKFQGTFEDKIQRVWTQLPESLWPNCFRAVEERLEAARVTTIRP